MGTGLPFSFRIVERTNGKGVRRPVMKDYYLILGLPRKADKNRIKKAYRDKVKSLHPDKTGESEDRQRFIEATEAYETLANDARRAEYDRQLERKKGGGRIPVRQAGQAPNARRRTGRKPGSVRDPNLEAGAAAFPERRMDLILSPLEAQAGGRFAIRVPVAGKCPCCARAGLLEQLLCSACGGAGIVEAADMIHLDIPSGISHGTVFEAAVETQGGLGVRLHVRVLIDPRL